MYMNIAIDGPAGAGKSTIARRVAKELGYLYVDTGAMYRAIALFLLRSGVDLSDEDAVSKQVKDCHVSIRYREGQQKVLLNGEDVSGLIRTEEVGNAASASSVYPEVRDQLTCLQRELSAQENLVMDGRDIGTTVLPHASLKIYLTASAKTRALRRAKEYEAQGKAFDLEQIQRDIEERDDRDMHRKISPLAQAKDAVRIDSSQMSIDQVVERILQLAEEEIK